MEFLRLCTGCRRVEDDHAQLVKDHRRAQVRNILAGQLGHLCPHQRHTNKGVLQRQLLPPLEDAP